MIIVISCLLLVIIIPLLLVFGLLKLVSYLEVKHPSWVGEGLRNKLRQLFVTCKYHSSKRNNPNTKIIPSHISRYFKNNINDYQNTINYRVTIFSRFKCFIHDIYIIHNPHNKDCATNTKDREKYLKQSIPIHTDKSNIENNKDQPNENETIKTIRNRQ
jgi:hypothetical protein